MTALRLSNAKAPSGSFRSSVKSGSRDPEEVERLVLVIVVVRDVEMAGNLYFIKSNVNVFEISKFNKYFCSNFFIN